MIYVCAACGKEFEKTGNPAKYCSPACKQKGQNDKIHTTNCVYCKSQFSYKGYHKAKFCSKQCVTSARLFVKDNPDSDLAKVLGWSTEKKTYTRWCIDCGSKILTKSPKDVNRRCSSCLDKYRKEFYKKGTSASARVIDALVDAESVEFVVGEAQPQKGDAQSSLSRQTREEYNANANRRRRELTAKRKALGLKTTGSKVHTYRADTLRGIDSPTCCCCSFNRDVDGLVIHHADMNRDNNDASNLKILCGTCHNIIHARIRRAFSENREATDEDKANICIDVLSKYMQECPSQSKTPELSGNLSEEKTRTEGCEESQSGAERSGTSRTDMNHQEAGESKD